MTRYVVKFFKEVLGDNGHQAEICQGALEVDAANSARCCRTRQARILRSKQLAHWSLHADRVSVAETEYPS